MEQGTELKLLIAFFTIYYILLISYLFKCNMTETGKYLKLMGFKSWIHDCSSITIFNCFPVPHKVFLFNLESTWYVYQFKHVKVSSLFVLTHCQLAQTFPALSCLSQYYLHVEWLAKYGMLYSVETQPKWKFFSRGIHWKEDVLEVAP